MKGECAMINEGAKIKLITGEIALISEVLEVGVAYIAEIFKKTGGISIDQINHRDISSVFEEIERPLATLS
jgi:hypothetical protein